MTGPGAGGAREALLELCARRPVWRLGGPQGSVPRRSAVLLLFGVLDAVPASRHAAAVADDLDLLLTRRSPTLTHHPSQVSFPGGGIDPGDTGPAAAALREAVEETGLDPTGVEVLGTLPALPVVASGNLVTPVLAWWTRPSAVAAADPAETVDVFRVPVAELVSPAGRVTAVLERQGRAYRGPGFLLPGALVWGFTAHVLDRLFDDLGWAVPWDAGREAPVEL